MKLRFDPNLDYQTDAIASIVDVFDGQPAAAGPHEVRLEAARGDLFTDLGLANSLLIDESRVLENVRAVQKRNGIPQIDELQGMNFSVEMETGTGKTYVYLRTLLELRQRYGFTKFVIVVPSVAIREGVLKNIELTKEHFDDLYGHVPVDAWIYDSSEVSRLRQFATADQLQILIINIDAFNKKDIAVIHRENDRLSGRKPIEFIQAAHPIVVIDEPQNMETETAGEAIESLNPLCTLRYSATHRNPYNLVYLLDPVRAYDLNLVKRIEVDSIREDPDFNRPYVQVEKVYATKTRVSARVEIYVQGGSGPRPKSMAVTSGDDLFEKSGGRPSYEGYVVGEVDAARGYITFTNGVRLDQGETWGGYSDEIMKLQVETTVREHLDKELAMRERRDGEPRIKVLSLFFIDRVAHYAGEEGKIRRWFEEAYERLREEDRYGALDLPPLGRAHGGYFAESRKGEPKDTSGTTLADDEAYALIMRDKERLLDPDEPLRFVFSHSALREGWDNPNVFQICTLNETRSEIKKRQEIGRGLRLPVMESGERCFDPNVNILTVVANESYEDFAKQLQVEIEEDCGVAFDDGRIKNRRERRQVRLKEGWSENREFVELWDRIKQRTRYSVRFDTDALIQNAAKRLEDSPPVHEPILHVERAAIDIGDEGVTTRLEAERRVRIDDELLIPDLLGYLQRETELTRGTLAEILVQSGRLSDAAKNPHEFLDRASRAIQGALHEMMVDGIEYEKIADEEYEMRRIEDDELVGYLSRLVPVGKSIYEAIQYDSSVERRFATDLDAREDIRFFVKLPSWFTIETPMGRYNPDWAIVKEEEGRERLYLVCETKGDVDPEQLRGKEYAKIECGKAHFRVLDVAFQTASKADHV